MQFNMLAEGLSAPPSSPPPFPSPDNRPSENGGFDQLAPADLASLQFSDRRWRLLLEIVSHSPDLLSVQEMDHFPDFFLPALSHFGYDGVFQPKQGSPCLSFGHHSDGVGVFWKRSLFSLAADHSSPESDGVKVPCAAVSLSPVPGSPCPVKKELLFATVRAL
jgi:hypothetical protein